ncbi:MAG: NADP-dependent phosphogluconate dehydrogenase [Thermoanaerobaculia bacterium]
MPETNQPQARFGMIGLGVMGANLALNVHDHGFPVAVWNLESEWVDRFIAEHGSGGGFTGTTTFEEFVAALERPRRIMMMIKAGSPVDQTIAKIAPLLDEGDVLVDGGNSWFRDTQLREAALRPKKIHFVGCGVSGGEEGARRGPSMMPGGSVSSWQSLAPVFEAIAAKTESGPCVTHVGPDGAGHFVKMVHNGIEYGDMQLIAEMYDLLRNALGADAGRLAEIFAEWNQGPLESFLIEITARIFRATDPETGRPLVDLVLDRAGQKGTGKWTAQVALDLAVPVPTIAAAIDARVLSSMKDERVAASRMLQGPRRDGSIPPAEQIIADAHNALFGAKICTYAQGMALIAAGSREYSWGVSLREMARIWKGGCIIRAKFLDSIMRAYERDPELPNLLVDRDFTGVLQQTQAGWRRTLGLAQTLGIPMPALSASLAYFDSYRTAKLPQNLTQAQRDYFGAHTYERADHPERGFVHTEWSDLIGK